MPNSRSSFDVSGSGTSGNERKSQSDMDNVVYNCTLFYGTCQSFGIIYSFFINVYNRSYLSGYTNQISDKQGCRSDHTILTCNRYKTFSTTFTRVILSMCCTESYCICWDKGVKYAPPSTKRFSRYLRWNSKSSKGVPFVRTKYKEYNIFI